MIKEWLEEYKPINHEAAEQALREIMQEIALAGLQRSGFFLIYKQCTNLICYFAYKICYKKDSIKNHGFFHKAFFP